MNVLTGFTDSPKQSTNITLEDGSFVVIDLYFRPQQMGWFFDLTYGEFVLLGQRLVYSPNLIRQFFGQIPFGLSVLTTDEQDPLGQTDFATGYAVMILLNQADVELVEQTKFTRNE